jgi:deazaflavin-dependent oxidoreductase (nitroreductase family)
MTSFHQAQASGGNRVSAASLPLVVRLLNPLIARLLHIGLPIRPMMLLTVRGRMSGRPRTTPVGLFEYNGKRYLFATFGEVNWTRNLRSARTAVLSLGRCSETVVAVELPAEQAAPFLKDAIAPLLSRASQAWLLRR